MKKKKMTSSPALEAKEEKMHKDLDGDNEKGEAPAHRAKVLGVAGDKSGKKTPPAFRNNTMGGKGKPTGARPVLARTSVKSYNKVPGKGKRCGDCTKSGASFCSHM